MALGRNEHGTSDRQPPRHLQSGIPELRDVGDKSIFPTYKSFPGSEGFIQPKQDKEGILEGLADVLRSGFTEYIYVGPKTT